MGGGQSNQNNNIQLNQQQNLLPFPQIIKNNTPFPSDFSLLESVCHSLYNIKKFHEEILDPKESIVNKKMSILLRQIFKNISKEDFSDYNKQMVELFKSLNFVIPSGPQILLFDILTILHLERKEQIQLRISTAPQRNIQYNAYDQNSAFQYFINNEIKENKSFIANIFRGVQQIKKSCQNNNPMYSFSYFDVFELNMPPIYNSFVKKYPNIVNLQGGPQITLYQCFEIFSSLTTQVINGQRVNEIRNIYSLPPCFIISINRAFKGFFFSGKVLYDDVLNMENYVLYKNSGVKYKLIGVIKQKGTNGNRNNLEITVRGVKPYNKNYFTLINEEDGKIFYFDKNEKKAYIEKIDIGFSAVILIYYRISA